MTLLDQSPLWIIPYILLILFMVHAMMEFTASLLVVRPQRKRSPFSAPELFNRLLQLNEKDPPIPLAPGVDCDLQIAWEQEDAPPRGRYFFSSSGGSGLVRLLLDETRHELRVNQVTRSHHILIGLVGWLPRLEGAFGFSAGPPGEALPEEISRAAISSGWTFRPVLWWFQATHRGFRLLTLLTPPPLRRVPVRRFWGVLYPLLYVLAMAILIIATGPLDREQWLFLLGISAVWWIAWGFLTWMLLGFPRLKKQTRR